MVSETRLTRIEERIKQELSEILLMESSDPRLKGVTITDVHVDRELSFAEIYVCTIEGVAASKGVLLGFEHAQGFLRRELTHRLDLRVFPKLRFHWDSTLENADKIDRLITSIHPVETGKKNASKKRRAESKDGSGT